MIELGTPAPSWKGLDQHEKPISSDSLKGMWYILYFYPKDFTPGCTKEACSFRDAFANLKKLARVIGVSADTAERHRSFIEKHSLPFTLVADPKKEIITAFGTDGFLFPRRVTFVIDPKGLVRKIYEKVDYESHAETIAEDLRDLQK
jgi:thioredoxin-dependent peroxiredoxin